MNERSKISPIDIKNKVLVEGVKYNFGSGDEIVVAVQKIDHHFWIKTQIHEGLFDLEGKFVALIYDSSED